MIYDFLQQTALSAPHKIAVIQGRRRVTYRELRTGIDLLAAFLVASGFRAGDRAGILMENSPEYIISYFGIQRAGGIPIDISTHFSAFEIGRVIANSSASLLIADGKFMKVVKELAAQKSSLQLFIAADAPPAVTPGRRNGSSPRREIELSGPGCCALTAILDTKKSELRPDLLLPAISGKDVAAIVYTSGTTGEPKGVTLSHDNLLHNAHSIVRYLRLTEQDRAMVVLPFSYSYGKSILTSHIMAGGSLVLENSLVYPGLVLEKMLQEEVTGFAGVPSTFAILLSRSNMGKYFSPALRYVTQAGGPMPPLLANRLAKAFPNTQIFLMYGQTEATARIAYLEPRDFFRKPGSIGKPIPGVEMELVKESGEKAAPGEEGEVVVSGGNVMLGYWNDPEETQKVLKGGKLYTGDIGRQDEEGYFYLVGRRREMIKSGAHRISPREIEEVILEIDGVREVSVIGTDNELLGAVIKAFVVLEDDREMTAAMVQRHCRTKLATFKVPRDVVFLDELPKTVSGKVRKYMLHGIQRPPAATC